MDDCFKICAGIISVIFLLVFVLAAVPLSADTVAEIKLTAEMEQEENVITVHVNLTENPGIAGLMFHFIYDKEILEVISVSDSILPSPVINDLEEGYIGYSFAEVQDYTETGAILSVTFQILDSEKLRGCILGLEKLDACNADLETVSIKETGGTAGELLKAEGGFLDSDREMRKWVLTTICILTGAVIAGRWLVQKKRKN